MYFLGTQDLNNFGVPISYRDIIFIYFLAIILLTEILATGLSFSICPSFFSVVSKHLVGLSFPLYL